MNNVAVIDYGLANIRSVVNALEYCGAVVKTVSAASELADCSHIVLPGVGSFDAGMRGLRSRGLVDPLADLVLKQRTPFMGICLGMQFLLDGSEEGHEPGLGWVGGKNRRFPTGDGLKIPHMGWSTIHIPRQSRMFEGISGSTEVYFLHSYYVPGDSVAGSHASAAGEYGLRFTAALEFDNIMACQFHPEKSQMAGLKIIQNFLAVTESNS
ncbi:MAG: imidazole glycerol phosphate synthase subunit HisH [Ferrovibrio sp.]